MEKEDNNALAHAYLALTLTHLGEHDAARKAMWNANGKADNGPIVDLKEDEASPVKLDKAIEAAIKYLEKQ